MLYIKNIDQFVNEYNRLDKTNILNRSNDLNVGIEIELEYRGDDSIPTDNIEENISNLSQIFKYSFNNFYSNYSSILKIVSDSTLVNGIEIVSEPFNSLDKAKEYISDFFEQYNNQEMFRFENSTGIHINISLKSDTDINYLKLFLFLNDTTLDGKAGFIYKDIEHRFQNKWTRPVKYAILKKIETLNLDNDNFIKEANNLIKNNFFKNKLAKKSYSIVVKDNYFEFRHLGGSNISLEKVLAKMEYFSYLSTLAFDPNYKRKEYLKKLYLFMDNIKAK